MMRFIKALYWRLFIFFLALRWIPGIRLGTQVHCFGRVHQIHDGRARPYWDLVTPDGCVLRQIHESEFKKVQNLANYWHNFSSGYRFYMHAWYGIWMTLGIESWEPGYSEWRKSLFSLLPMARKVAVTQ